MRFYDKYIDQYGRSPLITSCLKGKSEIASVLLESGADVNATTNVRKKKSKISSKLFTFENCNILIRMGRPR